MADGRAGLLRQRALPPARPLLVALALLASAGLIAVVAVEQGAEQVALLGLGLALGVTLYHARFGFTLAWQRLVSVGRPEGLRAHLLMVAVASVLFAPILSAGAGLFGAHAQGDVEPIGLSVAVGAFLFGVGMQVGGASASGTLYTIGGGRSASVLTLAGFVGGSVLGSWNRGFWTQDALTLGPVSLAGGGVGYGGALAIQLGFIGVLALGTVWIQRRRKPPPALRPPTAHGLVRALRGSWPLWVGAVFLAVLNAVTLLVRGIPWDITSAFATWGAKIVRGLGINVDHWAYWESAKHAKLLHGSLLADGTSLLDFGVILGAFAAAAIGGTFVLHRRVPWRVVVAAILGGLLMGYGARLAFGSNIGACFSGIASFSLHGWLWGAMALAGTFLGLKLRPRFGLTVPKSSDSTC